MLDIQRNRPVARFDADHRHTELRDGVLTRFPALGERLGQLGGSLASGHQTMLAVARAMMSEPKLLLLDEPFGRLSRSLVAEFADTIVDVNRSGVTIVFAEQIVDVATTIAHRTLHIEQGVVVSESGASGATLLSQ